MNDELKDWDRKMAEKDAALTKRNARIASLEAQLRSEKSRADGFSSMLAEGVKHLEKAEAALALEKEAGKVGEDMIAGLEAALAEARSDKEHIRAERDKWREAAALLLSCYGKDGGQIALTSDVRKAWDRLNALSALPATEPKPASVYENNGLEKAGIKHMGDCGQDGGCNPECRAFPTRKPTEREKARDAVVEAARRVCGAVDAADERHMIATLSHDIARLDAAERWEA